MKIRVDRLKQIIHEELKRVAEINGVEGMPTVQLPNLGLQRLNELLPKLTPDDLEKVADFAQRLASP